MANTGRIQLHSHVDRDDHDELLAVARRNERSLAAEIRVAVKAHVEREQAKPPAAWPPHPDELAWR
jgi:hypothetical protein